MTERQAIIRARDLWGWTGFARYRSEGLIDCYWCDVGVRSFDGAMTVLGTGVTWEGAFRAAGVKPAVVSRGGGR